MRVMKIWIPRRLSLFHSKKWDPLRRCLRSYTSRESEREREREREREKEREKERKRERERERAAVPQPQRFFAMCCVN